MQGLPQSDDRSPRLHQPDATGGGDRQPSQSDPKTHRSLGEPELEAALQLLVERARYITGATGAALALPYGEEMVCRASAGDSAPAVGVRLQVRFGLTGESISRRQLLRCDNAETDPRVNLETCRALGIASIVVLPLLRANGEVRGLFELFSDHPYAFEERDLVALERMAGLTATALDLAEQRHGSIPPLVPPPQAEKPVESAPSGVTGPGVAAIQQPTTATIPSPVAIQASEEPAASQTTTADPSGGAPSALAVASSGVILPDDPVLPIAVPTAVPEAASPEPVTSPESSPPALPESMLRVRKCESCGFPVSEGRTLCLDCEKKRGQAVPVLSAEPSAALAPAEDLPAFLANAVPVEESWLSNHVNLLAILVFIVGILVAVVVFR